MKPGDSRNSYSYLLRACRPPAPAKSSSRSLSRIRREMHRSPTRRSKPRSFRVLPNKVLPALPACFSPRRDRLRSTTFPGSFPHPEGNLIKLSSPSSDWTSACSASRIVHVQVVFACESRHHPNRRRCRSRSECIKVVYTIYPTITFPFQFSLGFHLHIPLG